MGEGGLRMRRRGGKAVKAKKGGKVKTRVVEGTRSPLWDELFTLQCEEWVEEVVVELVQPETITADVPLGRVLVSVDELEGQGGAMSGWFPLCSKQTQQPTQGLVYLALALDEEYLKEAERSSDRFLDHRRARLPPPSLTPHVYPTRVFCCTWNVGNAAPSPDLAPLLPLHLAEVYVVAVQECHYTARHDLKVVQDGLAVLSAAPLWGGVQPGQGTGAFGRYDWPCSSSTDWPRPSQGWARRRWPPASATCWSHTHLTHSHTLTQPTSPPSLSYAVTHSTFPPLSFSVVQGNKGGVCISLTIHHTQLSFVNVHLAAHQENSVLRNRNVQSIVKSLKFDAAGGGGGSGGSTILYSSSHHLILAGDLNYRLQYGDQGDAKSPSAELFGEMSGLCEQIIGGGGVAAAGPGGHRPAEARDAGWEDAAGVAGGGRRESPPSHPPSRYAAPPARATSPRAPPAWCDRILWKLLPGYRVTQLLLDSVPLVDTSDHKPVVSLLELDTFLLPAPLDPSKGACSLAILSLSLEDQPSVRWLDSQLSLDSALFPSSILTPPHRKPIPPQWLDLPTRTVQYNNIHRIALSLVHVKASVYGSGEVVGRGLVSLRPLGQYSRRGVGVGGEEVGVKGGVGGGGGVRCGGEFELAVRCEGGGGCRVYGEGRGGGAEESVDGL